MMDKQIDSQKVELTFMAGVTVMSIEQVREAAAARNSPEAKEARISALKSLIRVGLKVYVENGMHEILVPVKVCEVNEEGFKIEHKGRKTPSKWVDADFRKSGFDRPVLFDDKHSYTHIV